MNHALYLYTLRLGLVIAALFIVNVFGAGTLTKDALHIDKISAIIKQRQYQHPASTRRRGYTASDFNGKLSSWFAKRQETDPVCPPNPLPTIACNGCTTCRDATPSYCAKPNSDPSSCGTCNNDKVTCPAQSNSGQVATCTNGQCGVECDGDNGFFGPSNSCASAALVNHVTCPTLASVTFQSAQYVMIHMSSAPASLSCLYRPVNSAGNFMLNRSTQCVYDTQSGAWRSENVNGSPAASPTVCPASIAKSSTNGSYCYNLLSCATSLNASPGGTHTLRRASSSITYGNPTTNDGGSLACTWETSSTTQPTSSIQCTYNQSTGAARYGSRSIGSSFTVFPIASCPPLRTEYKNYCLLG